MLLQNVIELLSNKNLLVEYSQGTHLEEFITGLAVHSAQVKTNFLFFAIPGVTSDGTEFVRNACNSGAVAICLPDNRLTAVREMLTGLPVTLIAVRDVRHAVASVAQQFFEQPTSELCTIAVTGTNGKTSVSWILSEALAVLKGKAGYIGTLGVRTTARNATGILERLEVSDTANTTPDAISLARLLADFKTAGCVAAVMEVSSHALDQQRTRDSMWDAAVLTNITRDHLDYHKTFDAYIDAKALLFTRELSESCKKSCAIFNIGDPAVAKIARAYAGAASTFSLNDDDSDIFLVRAELTTTQSNLEISVYGRPIIVQTKLIGRYNAENTLAALTTLHALGFPLYQIADALSQVAPVPGRMEFVGNPDRPIIVDYAHTPDALKSVLSSLREIHPGSITTLFGCGGDRDRGKRPLMAQAVESLSDQVVLTSDNPRSESPSQIMQDTLTGFSSGYVVKTVEDRREALRQVVELQKVGELVLVAGKGHEAYQEICGVRHHFSDAEIIRGFCETTAASPRETAN